MVGIDERVQQLTSLVAELLTVTHQILASNPDRAASQQTVTVQLQELMQPRIIDPDNQHLAPNPSTPAGTATPSPTSNECTTPFQSPSMMTIPGPSYHDGIEGSDTASIRTTATTRSVHSIRSVRSISFHFTEALNNSRVYRLVQHRRPTSNSSGRDASSVFSVSTGSTNWVDGQLSQL